MAGHRVFIHTVIKHGVLKHRVLKQGDRVPFMLDLV